MPLFLWGGPENQVLFSPICKPGKKMPQALQFLSIHSNANHSELLTWEFFSDTQGLSVLLRSRKRLPKPHASWAIPTQQISSDSYLQIVYETEPGHLDHQSTLGKHPCHAIVTNNESRWIAHYSSGTLTEISKNGAT
jgi:hypothetical protein